MGTAASAVIDINVEGQRAAADLSKITAALSNLAENAKAAFAGVGAYIAVDALRDAASEMLDIFSQADRANTRLNSTLKATGNATGFSTAQLDAMRDQFRDTLGVAEKDMAEMQNIFARTRSIGGTVFIEAQKTAIDMAAAFGTDIPNAAEELSEAMQDPANELEKFRRFGIVFTDQEKAMLNQLQSTGRAMEAQRYVLQSLNKVVGGAATDAANTYAGAQQRIAAKMDSLYAAGGELIAKVLIPMQPIIASVIDTTIAWMPVIAEVANGLIGVGSAITSWIEPLSQSSAAVQEWAAVIKTVFTEWKTFIAVALLNAGANVVAFADTVAFYFTDTIPGYAKTLWIIMKDIFSQLGEMFGVAMDNMMKNFQSFWDALKSLMSGGSFDFAPLTPLEGFELKMSELPEIAERQMSETEKVMRQAADDLSIDLGNELAKNIDKQAEEAKAAADRRSLKSAETTGDKPLTLGQKSAYESTGSTGGTEGLLDLNRRIAEAAAQQKMVSAIASVADQQSQTNTLLTGIRDKDQTVKVDVKQEDVVAAINRQTEVLKKAYGDSGAFA